MCQIMFSTHRRIIIFDMSNKVKPTLDAKFLQRVAIEKLNFTNVTSMRCLDKIAQFNDIMVTRNNRENQERVEILKDELESARSATTRVIVRVIERRL